MSSSYIVLDSNNQAYHIEASGVVEALLMDLPLLGVNLKIVKAAGEPGYTIFDYDIGSSFNVFPDISNGVVYPSQEYEVIEPELGCQRTVLSGTGVAEVMAELLPFNNMRILVERGAGESMFSIVDLETDFTYFVNKVSPCNTFSPMD